MVRSQGNEVPRKSDPASEKPPGERSSQSCHWLIFCLCSEVCKRCIRYRLKHTGLGHHTKIGFQTQLDAEKPVSRIPQTRNNEASVIQTPVHRSRENRQPRVMRANRA